MENRRVVTTSYGWEVVEDDKSIHPGAEKAVEDECPLDGIEPESESALEEIEKRF